jgi:hypothetical protein
MRACRARSVTVLCRGIGHRVIATTLHSTTERHQAPIRPSDQALVFCGGAVTVAVTGVTVTAEPP